MKKALAIFSFVLFGYISFSYAAEKPLPTVESVDVSAYLGGWYEILRLPNEFQDEIADDGTGFGACFNTTAEYGLRNDERISVKNTCYRSRGSETKVEVADGKARVVDPSNAKLKVNFTGNPILERLGIGDGDYWILELGPIKDGKYQYSLVGTPDRNYLWVLSRVPNKDEAMIDKLLEKAESLGFDTEGIVYSR